MIGIAIQLLVSWALLHFFEKKNLEALGLLPTKRRCTLFLVGFIFSFAFVCIQQWVSSFVKHNPFSLNAAYHFNDFAVTCWYVIKSVCFEELIFRGALLYILNNRVGERKAIIISAAAFGIYHWFSWGVVGNPVSMAFVFITTSLVGLAYAYSFNKSGTIWMPMALHLGYNLSTMAVFSANSSIGNQLLVRSYSPDPVVPSTIVSILMMVFAYLVYPFLSFLLAKKIIK